MNAIKNSCRLLRVAYILSRYNALFPLEKLGMPPSALAFVKLVSKRNVVGRPGQRLARALNAAGPSFIKVGQALATRSDLLGEEIAQDLSELQDSLPPFPGGQARTAIETEFGVSVEELFTEFDETPVAAASIAQVHYAITSDGDEVAVKVLRPGIRIAFQRDLELLRWLAGLLELGKPDIQRLKPGDAVKKLAESVDMEMDLRLEAAAASELAENFVGDPSFVVPKVDWSRTGRCVMVTERLCGIPFNDRDALIAAGFDPMEILTKLANATFLQVFRDGFFHADVHPGNLFVTNDGAIGAVDFGIMGRLDFKTRKILAEMLLAFLTRNYRRAAEVHFEAGWVPATRSVDSFTQACRSIAEPILDKPQNEISIARLLGQLFQITQTFEMETQPQLLLLQKTMLVAEGSARILEPKANMWFLARPLIEEWAQANLGPEAQVRDAVESLTGALGRLPHIIDRIEERTASTSHGHVKLHPDSMNFIKRCSNNKISVLLILWLTVVIFILFLFLR